MPRDRTLPAGPRRGYRGGHRSRPGYGYGYGHGYGYGYPRAYGSWFYSPGFAIGLGYRPYFARAGFVYPRPYGSHFYFAGYPYTVGYGYPWSYEGAWGYGHTPFVTPYYGVHAADHPSLYQGSMRLKIKPREAEVYVDGYYVGVVDSFDGLFQRLRLEEGPHRVEIHHPHHQPIERDVLIVAGETVTWEERMQPR